jgi:AmpE protein
MTFIVILVTLLVERFFDWSHLRQWGWYGAYERAVIQKLSSSSPYLVLAGAILPLVVALVIIDHLTRDLIYGFPFLVFQLIALLYCYGPQNLWADSFASINTLTKDASPAGTEKLKATFNVSAGSDTESMQRQLISQIFIAANQRVFAVVFWFGVLGLPGALLYRLVSVSSTVSTHPDINASARQIELIMDWIPARLITFVFALGGNFTRVLQVWRQRAAQGAESNDVLLSECGMAAITTESEKIPQDGSLERSAISLLDRVFIIVLVAVMVLVFLF